MEIEFAVGIPDSKVSCKISDKDWRRLTDVSFNI
jgi:hypothetical protein